MKVIAYASMTFFWALVGVAVADELAPPSRSDFSALLSHRLKDAMSQPDAFQQTGDNTFKLNISLDTAGAAAAGAAYSNPLMAVLRADGRPLIFTRRHPVADATTVIFGASLSSGSDDGYIGELLLQQSLNGRTFPVPEPALVAQLMRTTVFPSGWTPRAPVAGRLEREGKELNYVIYRQPERGDRDCLVFFEGEKSFLLKVDFCVPLGQKIGRKRAEAIILSVGVDGYIPIKVSSDLATLPID